MKSKVSLKIILQVMVLEGMVEKQNRFQFIYSYPVDNLRR